MKKIFFTTLIVFSILNADYIPYANLKNMTYTLESGYRSIYDVDKILISIDEGEPSVEISKELYDELSKYPDYNHKLVKLENENYSLKIPKETFINLKHNKGAAGMTYEISHTERNKVCIGKAYINRSGFIWCNADTLESIFKK